METEVYFGLNKLSKRKSIPAFASALADYIKDNQGTSIDAS